MKSAQSNKRNTRLGAVTAILISALVYILLSTLPVQPPVLLRPVGLFPFPANGVLSSFSDEVPENGHTGYEEAQNGGEARHHAFVGQNTYGYYDDLGRFLYVGHRTDQIVSGGFALDDHFLLQSDRKNGAVWLSNIDDQFSVFVPVNGIPYISENRIFLLRNDQMGVAEMSPTGNLLWSREFNSVLTSIAIAKNLALFGFLDGSVQLNDINGRTAFALPARDFDVQSKYSGVYGSAISLQGERFALLYGLQPQYLLVFEKKDEGYGLVYKRKLAQGKKDSQFMLFDESGTALLAVTAEGLLCFDAKRNQSVALIQGESIASTASASAKFVRMGDKAFAGLISIGPSMDWPASFASSTSPAGESLKRQETDSRSIAVPDPGALQGTNPDRLDDQTRLIVVRAGICIVNMPMPEASDISWRQAKLFVTLPNGVKSFAFDVPGDDSNRNGTRALSMLSLQGGAK